MKISIKNLSKNYGKNKALDNIDLELDNGVYALLGPNGSGKTTLMHILSGLLSFNSGVIDVDEIAFCSNEYYGVLGYLSQYPIFYPNFTAREFLDYCCVLKGISKNNRNSLINDVLELTNLTDVVHKKICTFSGGMKQRLGIAQAIINKPKLILFDEPTAGLDPEERIRFRKIFSKISNECIILFATHIVSDVEMIANKVIFLKKGKIIHCDSRDNILKFLSDKVWLSTIDLESYNKLDIYKITNVSQIETNKYNIRIVSEEKPFINSKLAVPTLEDAYLYFFGDRNV